jgi:hypothetical protein
MNQTAHEQYVARIERDIRDGEIHIARQISAIERLRSDGQDTRLAKEVLETLRASQALHLWHRLQLLRDAQIDRVGWELRERARVAIAESKKLLSTDLAVGS